MKNFVNLIKVILCANVVIFSNQAFSVSEEFMKQESETSTSNINTIERLEEEVRTLRKNIRSLETDGRIYESKMGVVRNDYSGETDDGRMSTTRLTPLEVGERIARAKNRIYELENEISQRKNGNIEWARKFDFEREARDIGFKIKPTRYNNHIEYKSLENVLRSDGRSASPVKKFAQIIANISAKGFNVTRLSDPRQWSYANGFWYFDSSFVFNTPYTGYSWEAALITMERDFNIKPSEIPPRFTPFRCENALL